MELSLLIVIAYVTDLGFGDPAWTLHPVRIIGKLISKLEMILRRSVDKQKLAGIILAVSVIGITWAGTFGIIKISGVFNKYLSWAISVFFIYTSLSVKDLKTHGMKVYNCLKREDLINARSNLSFMVGRDTNGLEKKDIIRAAVESVSESIVDGIISPLFYAFMGGAPLAMAYKAVSTLDSMVGYKNERYKHLGWASAKIDDISNFIPARISAVLISVSARISGKDGWRAWKTALRDGNKNPSPNSGIPEAAVSGALGIRLGGLNFYRGIPNEKPFIGEDFNVLHINHIKETIKISYFCSLSAVISGLILTWLKYSM
jgi:adenosylcobinamide-phosphate synthase